ncbi:hypothetical protein ACIBQX_23680 [Nonomuraea sp. NPDC049714]|uniref:hypothetical protein n=1 Tax=Nonomuraea sp. NPDC049714 TaxID=3364357 RepID=UPI00379E0216
MRGHGPGSEHERRRENDGSAAPSTPPPSFGGRPSGEQRVPRSYPEPPSVEESEGWLSVEGETGAADGWQPRDGGPPAEAWLSVEDEPAAPGSETSPSLPRPPVPGETRPAIAWPGKGDRTRPADAWPPVAADGPTTWLPAKGGAHAAAEAETHPAPALRPATDTGGTEPHPAWHPADSGAQAAAGPASEGETRPAAWHPAESGAQAAARPAPALSSATNTGEPEIRPAGAWSGAQAAAARSQGEASSTPPPGVDDVRAAQGERLPALPDFPGAQPWEVREGDAAPYDWFAGPDGSEEPPVSGAGVDAPAHPGHEAMPQPAREPWAPEPVVPGAPRWEPPPAFTAAAAGMQVWPTPVTDTPAMPPWPAATGELDPGGEEGPHDTPQSGGPTRREADAPTAPAPHFDPNATTQHPQPASPFSTGQSTPPPAPPHGTGQSTPPPTAQPGNAPYGTGQSAPPPIPRQGNAPFSTGAVAAHGAAAPFSAPVPADTDEAASPSAARKAIPGRTTPTPGPKLPPSPLFNPNQGMEQADQPAGPGDVPVWPPAPHGAEQQGKLPDLPFDQETWGQRPALALPPGGAPSADLVPQGGAAFRQPPFAPLQVVEQPGKSKRALFATLGVLVLAGVATGGFFAVRSVGAPTPEAAAPTTSAAPSATPTAAPAVPTPAEAAGTAMLNSEITDPKKLSLSEAFPKKKVSAAGATFTRVKSDVAASCQEAAAGAFAEALREQKCSRVLRATYVDAKRRWAVTTGIAVLPSKDAALRVDKAKNLSRNLWFRALPGSPGSGGDRVHIAGGYAAGLVWGRYIVFSYATHADGHTPEAKEKTLIKVSSAFRDQTSLVLERRVTDG